MVLIRFKRQRRGMSHRPHDLAFPHSSHTRTNHSGCWPSLDALKNANNLGSCLSQHSVNHDRESDRPSPFFYKKPNARHSDTNPKSKSYSFFTFPFQSQIPTQHPKQTPPPPSFPIMPSMQSLLITLYATWVFLALGTSAATIGERGFTPATAPGLTTLCQKATGKKTASFPKNDRKQNV